MGARNTKSGGSLQEDYVRPVTYTCRSLDHEIDNDDEVLDSLNHFSRPDSGAGSQLKRRQSSEDFLEMQAAREYQQYCMDHPDLMYHHRYDDFSSSPDPYEEEAMVDDEDMDE